ncbi:hypothetical protein [Streptosporangium carneum]|uniref:Polyketide cyclase n=1 Tax=Streptosporangium carneum TaxID=47481 RepID=A0A9W6HWX9_9ACTN|nr:hypothetical protein [Streptosporangium carneum]GLK07103.1 hypothetical protein GCM10017600_05080 [Streptosporangium carneum]
MKKTLLYEVAGVVETSPERVKRLILAVRPGPVGPDNVWLLSSAGGTVEGGPGRFTLRMPGHAMTVEVTEETFAAQGGWWYRGEYTVEPHPEGTLFVHRVFNVAARGRWAAPLANRLFVGFGGKTRSGFADGLRLIGRELDCGTRLL